MEVLHNSLHYRFAILRIVFNIYIIGEWQEKIKLRRLNDNGNEDNNMSGSSLRYQSVLPSITAATEEVIVTTGQEDRPTASRRALQGLPPEPRKRSRKHDDVAAQLKRMQDFAELKHKEEKDTASSNNVLPRAIEAFEVICSDPESGFTFSSIQKFKVKQLFQDKDKAAFFLALNKEEKGFWLQEERSKMGINF